MLEKVEPQTDKADFDEIENDETIYKGFCIPNLCSEIANSIRIQ